MSWNFVDTPESRKIDLSAVNSGWPVIDTWKVVNFDKVAGWFKKVFLEKKGRLAFGMAGFASSVTFVCFSFFVLWGVYCYARERLKADDETKSLTARLMWLYIFSAWCALVFCIIFRN